MRQAVHGVFNSQSRIHRYTQDLMRYAPDYNFSTHISKSNVCWQCRAISTDNGRRTKRESTSSATGDGGKEDLFTVKNSHQPVVDSSTYIQTRDIRLTEKANAPPTISVAKNKTRNSERMSLDELAHYIDKNLSGKNRFMQECQVEPNSDRFDTRLVDTEPFKYNYDFWEQILMTRARVHKNAGVIAVWEGMRFRNIDIPVRGAQAHIFWQMFLRTGLCDEAFLDSVWLYIQDLHSRKQGRKYKKLYETLVGGFMTKDPAKALTWHHRLRSAYCIADSAAFFHRYLSRTDLLPTLEAIYKSLKSNHLYSIIIPCLSLRGQFPAAQKWHKLLLRHGDVPEDSSKADLLVTYLVQHQSLTGLGELLKGLSQRAVPLVSSTLLVLMSHRSRIKELIPMIEKYTWSLDPQGNDEIWSLVASYKEMPLEEVQRLMQHFRVDKVDKMTASALTLRQEATKDFLAGAKRLKSMHPMLDTSIHFRLIHEATKLNVDKWYPHVFDKLKGPDFAEHQLKEALLVSYLKQHKWRSFDKTYLSLTHRTPKTWNYLLQSCIMRNFSKSVFNILERMRMLNIPPENITSSLLFTSTLPTRRRGHRPPGPLSAPTTFECVRILKKISDGGGDVKAVFWVELCKRLGMSKQFHALESLSLWLVERHKRRSNVSLHNAVHTDGRLCQGTVEHPCTSSQHVFDRISSLVSTQQLDKIFSKNLIRAIIAWGFLDTRPFSWSSVYISRHAHIDPLLASNCARRMSWGIYLIRALKANGVHVDDKSVVREVRLRLRSLFGIAQSERPSVRRAVRETTMTPEEIINLVNKSWGSKIMPDLDLADEYSLQKYIGWKKNLAPSAIRRARRRKSLKRTRRSRSLGVSWALLE